jgi:hypothetical protein
MAILDLRMTIFDFLAREMPSSAAIKAHPGIVSNVQHPNGLGATLLASLIEWPSNASLAIDRSILSPADEVC